MCMKLLLAPSPIQPYPSQLVLSDGAGVHECLGDDREHGVHVVRRLDVKDKLRVLHNVDPETQRETGDSGNIEMLTCFKIQFASIFEVV